jgi:hypothetical protein
LVAATIISPLVNHSRTAPLLQPLTATTPLAALLNRWLVALAPAAALINPARTSIASECLCSTTASLHFYHQTLTKVIARLEASKDLRNLWPVMRFKRGRMNLSRPVVEQHAALALAVCGDKLTARQVYKMPSYVYPHLDKLIAQPSPFSADCALLMALFAGGARAVQELQEPSNEGCGKADALAILRQVLAADAEGLRECLGAIDKRAEGQPYIRRG